MSMPPDEMEKMKLTPEEHRDMDDKPIVLTAPAMNAGAESLIDERDPYAPVTYTLKKPIRAVAVGGDDDLREITLHPPTAYRRNDLTKINGMLQSAQLAVASQLGAALGAAQDVVKTEKAASEEAAKTPDQKGMEALNQVDASGKGNDLAKVMERLFKGHAATFNDDKPVLEGIIGEMSYDDWRGLMACYIGNFILAS